jgi:hypothetical protein
MGLNPYPVHGDRVNRRSRRRVPAAAVHHPAARISPTASPRLLVIACVRSDPSAASNSVPIAPNSYGILQQSATGRKPAPPYPRHRVEPVATPPFHLVLLAS